MNSLNLKKQHDQMTTKQVFQFNFWAGFWVGALLFSTLSFIAIVLILTFG